MQHSATAMTGSTPARIPVELLVLLGGLAAVGPFSIDTYLPALPTIAGELGITADRAQATLSAYFIGLAAGQLVMGPLADRYGRRVPLLLGLVMYVLASGLCAAAPSIETLLAGRALQAFGACGGLVASRAVLRDLYGPRDMARAMSMIMLVMGVAPIVAPMFGTVVGGLFGWRIIFVALGLYGLTVLAVTGWRLPETLPSAVRRPLQLGRIVRTYGSLLVEPAFMGNAIAGGLVQAGLFAYIASSSFVLMEVYGLESSTFAMVFGFNAVGLIGGSQLNERLLRRTSPERVLVGVMVVYVLATTVLLATAMTGFGGLLGVLIPLWFAIASLGFSFPNTTALAMGPVGDRAGSAAALLGTLQYGLAGLSSFVAGLLYTGSALGMAEMMFACGILAAVALGVSARITPSSAPATVPAE